MQWLSNINKFNHPYISQLIKKKHNKNKLQWINVGTRSSVNTKIKIDENKEIIMNLIPKWHINKSRHKLKLTIILRAVNTPNLKIHENHYYWWECIKIIWIKYVHVIISISIFLRKESFLRFTQTYSLVFYPKKKVLTCWIFFTFR